MKRAIKSLFQPRAELTHLLPMITYPHSETASLHYRLAHDSSPSSLRRPWTYFRQLSWQIFDMICFSHKPTTAKAYHGWSSVSQSQFCWSGREEWDSRPNLSQEGHCVLLPNRAREISRAPLPLWWGLSDKTKAASNWAGTGKRGICRNKKHAGISSR